MDAGTLLRRAAAGSLGGVFLFTNCLFAHTPEESVWEKRRRFAQSQRSDLVVAGLPRALAAPSNLDAAIPAVGRTALNLSPRLEAALPKQFTHTHHALLRALSNNAGTIRRVALPAGKKTGPIVVHIQDVHGNTDAQRNIAQTVQNLVDSNQVGLVALEGASGLIPLKPYREFYNQEAVHAVADYLLKEHSISGPIHAALKSPRPIPAFIGVEDPAHYAANVEAYRQAAPAMAKVQKEIAETAGRIEAEKSRVYSPALLALDRAVSDYHKGVRSLGDYVQTLAEGTKSLPKSVKDFSQALALEKSLDFEAVERERARLIENLVRTLDKGQIEGLVAHSVAYRTGTESYTQFYAYLNNLCKTAGVSLNNLPAMEKYVQYVLLSDRIEAEALLQDLAALEWQAYQNLAATREEAALVQRSKANTLAAKLADFSLTPGEWGEYQKSVHSEQQLEPFEAFYREAHIRDEKLAQNLLANLKSNAKAAVLVAGGYHAEGITQQLTAAGATVISLVPRIDKIDIGQGSAYLSVFTQEKAPLEKLFQGEKLFLARNPAHGLIPEGSVAIAGAALFPRLFGRPLDENDLRATTEENLTRKDVEELNRFLQQTFGTTAEGSNNVELAGQPTSDVRALNGRIKFQLRVHGRVHRFSLGLGVAKEGVKRRFFIDQVERNIDIRNDWPESKAARASWVFAKTAARWLGPWAVRCAHLTEGPLLNFVLIGEPRVWAWFVNRHENRRPSELMYRFIGTFLMDQLKSSHGISAPREFHRLYNRAFGLFAPLTLNQDSAEENVRARTRGFGQGIFAPSGVFAPRRWGKSGEEKKRRASARDLLETYRQTGRVPRPDLIFGATGRYSLSVHRPAGREATNYLVLSLPGGRDIKFYDRFLQGISVDVNWVMDKENTLVALLTRPDGKTKPFVLGWLRYANLPVHSTAKSLEELNTLSEAGDQSLLRLDLSRLLFAAEPNSPGQTASRPHGGAVEMGTLRHNLGGAQETLTLLNPVDDRRLCFRMLPPGEYKVTLLYQAASVRVLFYPQDKSKEPLAYIVARWGQVGSNKATDYYPIPMTGSWQLQRRIRKGQWSALAAVVGGSFVGKYHEPENTRQLVSMFNKFGHTFKSTSLGGAKIGLPTDAGGPSTLDWRDGTLKPDAEYGLSLAWIAACGYVLVLRGGGKYQAFTFTGRGKGDGLAPKKSVRVRSLATGTNAHKFREALQSQPSALIHQGLAIFKGGNNFNRFVPDLKRRMAEVEFSFIYGKKRKVYLEDPFTGRRWVFPGAGYAGNERAGFLEYDAALGPLVIARKTTWVPSLLPPKMVFHGFDQATETTVEAGDIVVPLDVNLSSNASGEPGASHSSSPVGKQPNGENRKKKDVLARWLNMVIPGDSDLFPLPTSKDSSGSPIQQYYLWVKSPQKIDQTMESLRQMFSGRAGLEFRRHNNSATVRRRSRAGKSVNGFNVDVGVVPPLNFLWNRGITGSRRVEADPREMPSKFPAKELTISRLATSLWGVKLAEKMFGARFGTEPVGRWYKTLAPAIGAMAALVWMGFAAVGLNVLGGAAVSGVVAPLLGAVFGGLFIASHYLLPKSWLPKTHSIRDISPPKVITMALLYAGSITLSFWGIAGLEVLGIGAEQLRSLALAAWPMALATHGVFDGWGRLQTMAQKLTNKLNTSPIKNALRVAAMAGMIFLIPLASWGGIPLANKYDANPDFYLETPTAPVFPKELTGAWDSDDPRFMSYLIYELHYPQFDRRANAAITLRQLGPAARPAIPALITVLLGERPRSVRGASTSDTDEAYETLRPLVPFDAQTVGRLRAYLQNTNQHDYRLSMVIALLRETKGFQPADRRILVDTAFRLLPASYHSQVLAEQEAELALAEMENPLATLVRHEWVVPVGLSLILIWLGRRLYTARERKIRDLEEKGDAVGLVELIANANFDQGNDRIFEALNRLSPEQLAAAREGLKALLGSRLFYVPAQAAKLLLESGTPAADIAVDLIVNGEADLAKPYLKLAIPGDFEGHRAVLMQTLEAGKARRAILAARALVEKLSEPPAKIALLLAQRQDLGLEGLQEAIAEARAMSNMNSSEGWLSHQADWIGLLNSGTLIQAAFAAEILRGKLQVDPAVIEKRVDQALRSGDQGRLDILAAYNEARALIPALHEDNDLLQKLFGPHVDRVREIPADNNAAPVLSLLERMGPAARGAVPALALLKASPRFVKHWTEREQVLVGAAEPSVGIYEEQDVPYQETVDLTPQIDRVLAAIFPPPGGNGDPRGSSAASIGGDPSPLIVNPAQGPKPTMVPPSSPVIQAWLEKGRSIADKDPLFLAKWIVLMTRLVHGPNGHMLASSFIENIEKKTEMSRFSDFYLPQTKPIERLEIVEHWKYYWDENKLEEVYGPFGFWLAVSVFQEKASHAPSIYQGAALVRHFGGFWGAAVAVATVAAHLRYAPVERHFPEALSQDGQQEFLDPALLRIFLPVLLDELKKRPILDPGGMPSARTTSDLALYFMNAALDPNSFRPKEDGSGAEEWNRTMASVFGLGDTFDRSYFDLLKKKLFEDFDRKDPWAGLPHPLRLRQGKPLLSFIELLFWRDLNSPVATLFNEPIPDNNPLMQHLAFAIRSDLPSETEFKNGWNEFGQAASRNSNVLRGLAVLAFVPVALGYFLGTGDLVEASLFLFPLWAPIYANGDGQPPDRRGFFKSLVRPGVGGGGAANIKSEYRQQDLLAGPWFWASFQTASLDGAAYVLQQKGAPAIVRELSVYFERNPNHVLAALRDAEAELTADAESPIQVARDLASADLRRLMVRRRLAGLVKEAINQVQASGNLPERIIKAIQGIPVKRRTVLGQLAAQLAPNLGLGKILIKSLITSTPSPVRSLSLIQLSPLDRPMPPTVPDSYMKRLEERTPGVLQQMWVNMQETFGGGLVDVGQMTPDQLTYAASLARTLEDFFGIPFQFSLIVRARSGRSESIPGLFVRVLGGRWLLMNAIDSSRSLAGKQTFNGYLYDLENLGADPIRLTKGGFFKPFWASPDGRWLALEIHEDHKTIGFYDLASGVPSSVFHTSREFSLAVGEFQAEGENAWALFNDPHTLVRLGSTPKVIDLPVPNASHRYRLLPGNKLELTIIPRGRLVVATLDIAALMEDPKTLETFAAWALSFRSEGVILPPPSGVQIKRDREVRHWSIRQSFKEIVGRGWGKSPEDEVLLNVLVEWLAGLPAPERVPFFPGLNSSFISMMTGGEIVRVPPSSLAGEAMPRVDNRVAPMAMELPLYEQGTFNPNEVVQGMRGFKNALLFGPAVGTSRSSQVVWNLLDRIARSAPHDQDRREAAALIAKVALALPAGGVQSPSFFQIPFAEYLTNLLLMAKYGSVNSAGSGPTLPGAVVEALNNPSVTPLPQLEQSIATFLWDIPAAPSSEPVGPSGEIGDLAGSPAESNAPAARGEAPDDSQANGTIVPPAKPASLGYRIAAALKVEPRRLQQIGLWSLFFEIPVLVAASVTFSPVPLAIALAAFAVLHGALQTYEESTPSRDPPLRRMVRLLITSLFNSLLPATILSLYLFAPPWLAGTIHFAADVILITGANRGGDGMPSIPGARVSSTYAAGVAAWRLATRPEQPSRDSEAGRLAKDLAAIAPSIAAFGSVNDLDGSGLRRAILDTSITDEEALARLLRRYRGGGELSEAQAMAWLERFLQGGGDTDAAVMVPVSAELRKDSATLTRVARGLLALHRGPIVFLTEDGRVPGALGALLDGRANVGVAAAPGLLEDNKLALKVLEGNIPADAAAVKVYQPKGYHADFNGVTDERLRRADFVPMETLSRFIDRLHRLAVLLATQA